MNLITSASCHDANFMLNKTKTVGTVVLKNENRSKSKLRYLKK